MQDILIKRVTNVNADFKNLVALLDQSLAITDGDEHGFYDQYNGLEEIHHAVVAYLNRIPVACGALKKWSTTAVEIKRMYTLPEYRGRGLGSQIIAHLANWTKELGYTRMVLETGKRQPDAIALYEKNGFVRIPNYEPYAGMENSVCFEKVL